jgi:hypothetical protein
MMPIYRYSQEKPPFGAAFLFAIATAPPPGSFRAAQAFLGAQGNAIAAESSPPVTAHVTPWQKEYPEPADTPEVDQPSFQNS